MEILNPHKGYSQAPSGQVHWRIWGDSASADEPDLYCLHPGPFSGLAFADIAPLLSNRRRVIAPDYPGFGGSDKLEGRATIENYAAVMQEVILALSGSAKIDLLGFHTGCMVAAELAAAQPASTRRLCIVDAPTFDPEGAAAMAAASAYSFVIEDNLACLSQIWKNTYSTRQPIMGAEAAFALFAEQLRAGSGMRDAFHAAFAYSWEPRFASLGCETLVFATQSELLESTRLAAKTVPHARYVERLDITQSVLNAAASEVADEVRQFLEQTW